MATRSNINVKVGNNYHSIYCHFDGYPSGVGYYLLNFYNSQELAEKLVSLGDASCIYESCEKPEGHSYDNQVKGYTVYYGRDRGEDEREFVVTDVPIDDEGHCYIWNGTEWTITFVEYDNDDNEHEYVNTPLTKVLGMEEDEEDESDKMLKYFGCGIDEVIAINNEWSVTFNTPDSRMTDAYNERIRWMVRHREAPYQGLDSDGIWHHSFFGRTLLEAVIKAEEYLKRGQEFEKSVNR